MRWTLDRLLPGYDRVLKVRAASDDCVFNVGRTSDDCVERVLEKDARL